MTGIHFPLNVCLNDVFVLELEKELFENSEAEPHHFQRGTGCLELNICPFKKHSSNACSL